MKVLLFGITREIIGQHALELTAAETGTLATAGELKEHLMSRYPRLKDLNSLALAVNKEYANPGHRITASDEIALIPPVSGG